MRTHETLILCVSLGSATCHAAETAGLRKLFEAIRQVETGGISQGGKDLWGDDGRSLGPYQIQRPYWQDSGVPGRYEHVRDPRYSERVMLGYWRRYCPEALAQGDWRTLARVHNGGPQGARNPATIRYWEKVKRALRDL